MKRIVIASGNKGKIKEFAEMLTDYEVLGCKELGITEEIEENGTTFYENALIKAKYVSKKLGVPCLADDSGLMVECLDGAPGVYSARYAGENATDKLNNEKLLNEMKNSQNRRAKFVSSLVLYYPDGKVLTANGETHGEILTESQGENGFGYDPLFFSYDLNKSFGIASDEEKNSVSHRGRALKSLVSQIQKR